MSTKVGSRWNDATRPARAFIERRRRDGKTTTEAIRALKRHITRAAYNVLSQAHATPT